METYDVFGEDWEAEVERPGGRFKDTPIGPRIGAERLGGSLYELPPGGKGWPYHWHHANEELVVVLRGTPTLREPAGERVLQPGDCVLFPRGPDGAHTLRNDADEPARFLVFSTLVSPEMVTYPDSGKVGARSRFWGGLFREQATVGYWEDEE